MKEIFKEIIMERKEYTSLKKLVGQDFTVEKVWGYKWKKWDNVAKVMMTSDTYVAEHSKKYDVDTNKGKMDISASQLGSMLEGVQENGVSDLIGKTFHVKSNGKDGMEIRYFINPVRDAQPQTKPVQNTPDEEPINLDDIPF
jgi:predicted SPOUT superfamily RNA methylase MTH1